MAPDSFGAYRMGAEVLTEHRLLALSMDLNDAIDHGQYLEAAATWLGRSLPSDDAFWIESDCAASRTRVWSASEQRIDDDLGTQLSGAFDTR